MPFAFQFMNPAGGLGYHAKALIYGPLLWKDFRREIRAWLSRWNPPERKLLIIGQSGGYMLSRKFLGRFVEVTAVDPDPLAAWIFKKRFQKVGPLPSTKRDDFFVRTGSSTIPLQRFFSQHPDSAILFSNFLGQIPFLIRDEQERENLIGFWQVNLLKLLRGRSWASFHDRYSGSMRPADSAPLRSNRQLHAEELIGRFYEAGKGGQWIDHQTGGYFPEQTTYDYFLWRLAPRAFHIIEGVHFSSSQLF